MNSIEYKVLDQGSIILVNYIGSDNMIPRYARLCYNNLDKISNEEQDNRLIETLLCKGHFTPFEFINFHFEIVCPIFVARQWMRHRIGSFIEQSGRYCDLSSSSFYIPESLQSTDEGEMLYESYECALYAYQQLLNKGVRKEQARLCLPLGLNTHFLWNVNFRALMNFLQLRLDRSAQYEIREYAKAIKQILYQVIPVIMKTFDKYI